MAPKSNRFACCFGMNLFFLFYGAICTQSPALSEQVRQTLQHVEFIVNNSLNCTAGTSEQLPIHFNLSAWHVAEEVCVRMSNYLSRVYTVLGEHELADEEIYQYLAANIDGQSRIYAAWASFEPGVHRNYSRFAPYAAIWNESVKVHDVSLSYDYREPGVAWYEPVRSRPWNNTRLSTLRFEQWSPRDNHSSSKVVIQPLLTVSDGIWTPPYYDCGGGNIWMCSYLLPIFTTDGDQFVLGGAVGVDIHLSQIDINQCDTDDDSTEAVDYFVGSHHCHPSTNCEFRPGRGFRRGNYVCRCRDGFYFANQSARTRYFDGVLIENYYDNHNVSRWDSPFQCLPCAEGCEQCVDSTPCMVAYSALIRGSVLALSILFEATMILLIVAVVICADRPSLKSGSPMFLCIMCAGGALMLGKVTIKFFQPNSILCQAEFWFELIGFSLMFGALLLKTWRIAALCTVKTAKTVTITDRVLLNRLIPMTLAAIAFLTAWTASQPLFTKLYYTKEGKKFYDCSVSWWLLIAHCSEVVLLVWGAYLCFSARKAPSAFNESRYITWAIYNAVLTGNFLLVVIYFFILQEGPDLLYVMELIRMVVIAVATVGIILIPKMYAIRNVPPLANMAITPRKSTFYSHATTNFGSQLGTPQHRGSVQTSIPMNTGTVSAPAAKKSQGVQVDMDLEDDSVFARM